MTVKDDQSELPFEATADVNVTRWGRVWHFVDVWVTSPARIVWEDFRTRVGLLILMVYILMGTVGVVVYPVPKLNAGPRLVGAFQNPNYILGTTTTGQDLLGLMIHSTPFMLKMVIAGAVFTTVMSVVIGTVSGYKRGRTDQVLMGLSDIALVIPGLPLVIVLSIAIQPEDPFVVGVLLTINGWAGLARSVRSEVISLRNEAYIEASSVMGLSTASIILKDILPNIMPYVLINFMQAGRNVIFASVGLYYLGLLPFSALNWGVILNTAQKSGALNGFHALHWIIVPIVTISGLVFALVYFSQGLDRIFNPRIRARHAKTVETDSIEEV